MGKQLDLLHPLPALSDGLTLQLLKQPGLEVLSAPCYSDVSFTCVCLSAVVECLIDVAAC